MSRVVFHNFSIPYRDNHPDLFYFDHNGLFAAEPGDVVVLRAGIPNHKEFIAHLQACGVIAPGIAIVYSKSFPALRSVHEDKEVAEALQVFIGKQTPAPKLDTFVTTVAEEAFADTHKLQLSESVGQYYNYATKSAFRKLAKQSGLPVPHGFAGTRSVLQVVWQTIVLFASGAKEVVVRRDLGAGGLSTVRWTRMQFLHRLSTGSWAGLLPTIDTFAYQEQACVVEEWHQSVSSRPSVQCYVGESGDVQILSVHDQLMGENLQSYIGCRSEVFMSPELVQQVRAAVVPFLERISTEGYRGHIAFNAIYTTENQLLFTEINPRRVISSYAWLSVQRLLKTNAVNKVFYQLEEIEREDWRGLEPLQVQKQFASRSYQPATREGLLVLDPKYIGVKGSAMVLAVADTSVKVEELLQYAKSC